MGQKWNLIIISVVIHSDLLTLFSTIQNMVPGLDSLYNFWKDVFYFNYTHESKFIFPTKYFSDRIFFKFALFNFLNIPCTYIRYNPCKLCFLNFSFGIFLTVYSWNFESEPFKNFDIRVWLNLVTKMNILLSIEKLYSDVNIYNAQSISEVHTWTYMYTVM